jgi:hypothetical protein
MEQPFDTDVTPDWQGLRDCILRQGTPRRVHHIELFLDREIQEAIARDTVCWTASLLTILLRCSGCT